LFQAQFPEPDKLELLLARLRSIAGPGDVGSPELLNSHGDDAFAMNPFRPNLRAGTEREAGPRTCCPPHVPATAIGTGDVPR
jgi:hypothetical protein